ncbi:MAG: adenosylhomocysteinase [Actinobacteria bacterium RBG_19FT_COMBO_54_7]|uniref:Adenosylhomocysteinase n=1 Tax=Candidatus Solincola sediminis TaxID=1797199 RepID=A0A1F2WU21_9ACTN|nr:MAG: adenosylhomocysteinase [Candidatus Solincola sediminis]OFW60323.1 MAG: adenosylhomocysteinase [Candidatus Solincola sediminis]OFW65578.1 MAG: adenosylhomocysteinase [Actinobacteria bacterium RBG_19FT_COMBO_54_7]
MDHDVKDMGLADEGRLRIEWAERDMPVLRKIRERFDRDKPLAGVKTGSCLHVTTETANLMITLKAGGAEVILCASNPLSTQDDVAAALVKHYEIPVFAIKGEDNESYYSHINAVLDAAPDVTMDDGADLISTLHSEREEQAKKVWAGAEETTTGVIRLEAMAEAGVLLFPVIAVNNAMTKHLFDNRFGTGQSTLDGILRATNVLLAGRKVSVFGYGMCGRGVASRARGMGALVNVVETDPLRALEAVMEGFSVSGTMQAAQTSDLFITVTGDIHVLRREHFEAMKDGAILANSGHFNVEIDIPVLQEMATGSRRVRENVEEFLMPDGRKIYLLAEGRLVNLAAAEGHPASVMDMSFANQALVVEYVKEAHSNLENCVYDVPESLDREIARLKLQSMGIEIDALTAEQQEYLCSWEMGT